MPTTALPLLFPYPALWQAVLTRDRSAEGRFVYAVTSTRIYCRPTCPSRRPRPDGVPFFATTSAAKLPASAPVSAANREAPQSPDAAWLEATRRLPRPNSDSHISLAEFARLPASPHASAARLPTSLRPQPPRLPIRPALAIRSPQSFPAPNRLTAALYDSGYNPPAPHTTTPPAPSPCRPPRPQRRPGESIVYTIIPTP